MAVNGVSNYNYVNNAHTHHTSHAEKAEENTTAAATETAENAGETTAATTAPQQAETYKPDMDKINQMKADMSRNLGAYKQMVFSEVKTQGNHADSVLKNLLKGVAGMSQEDAAKAVADDGEWGVDATAGRILDFAKALSGGDPSKIAMLKDAVQKGFGAAGKVWGGELPEISQKTLAKVMEGFDEWEKSGNANTAAAQASGIIE